MLANPFQTKEQTLPNMQNVVAGGVSTLVVPLGVTYHEIFMRYSNSATDALKTVADIVADIEHIRLKVNGKVQRDLTGKQLLEINAFYGEVARDGHIPLHFFEKWRENLAEAYSLSMGTADIAATGSVTIEIKIKTGVVNPALTGFANVSQDGRPMGQIAKMLPYTVQVTATGAGTNKHDFPKIDTLCAIHNFSADIDNVEVIVNNSPLIDELPQDVIDSRLISDGFTPQAGVTHLKFDRDTTLGQRLFLQNLITTSGLLSGRQSLVQDFRVNYNMSAATSFETILETVGFRN